MIILIVWINLLVWYLFWLLWYTWSSISDSPAWTPSLVHKNPSTYHPYPYCTQNSIKETRHNVTRLENSKLIIQIFTKTKDGFSYAWLLVREIVEMISFLISNLLVYELQSKTESIFAYFYQHCFGSLCRGEIGTVTRVEFIAEAKTHLLASNYHIFYI